MVFTSQKFKDQDRTECSGRPVVVDHANRLVDRLISGIDRSDFGVPRSTPPPIAQASLRFYMTAPYPSGTLFALRRSAVHGPFLPSSSAERTSVRSLSDGYPVCCGGGCVDQLRGGAAVDDPDALVADRFHLQEEEMGYSHVCVAHLSTLLSPTGHRKEAFVNCRVALEPQNASTSTPPSRNRWR